MSDTREAFEERARESYVGELDDLRKALRLLRAGDNLNWRRAERARELASEICGEPLSIERQTVVTVTLSTGGPASGYEIWLDDDGQPESGSYWYQDWFTEKRHFHLSSYEIDDVIRAYDLPLGE